MTDLIDSARSIVRDRMRGNRPGHKHGDTGPNACLIAATQAGVTRYGEALALLPYAYGYGLALNGSPILDLAAGLCDEHAMAALDGFLAGLADLREGPVFPAAVSVHDGPPWGDRLVDR